MAKSGPAAIIETPKKFTDVLYITHLREMPPEIKSLLKDKKLTYLVTQIDDFSQLLSYLHLIGTVIIDAQAIDVSQQQKLAGIIESLEVRNIGTIIINSRIELPIRSFSLAPSQSSFSMATKMETVSIDDLWVRIGVNLAYRRQSSGIISKPPTPPKHTLVIKNKLAQQLRTTELLVDNIAEQLRMAGLVQRDFLPAQLPNCDKVRWSAIFIPSEWVSGDIYDIARIDERHMGFYIADVVGHGMPAALLTIFLKQALVMRETINNNYHIFKPADVLKNLNKRMGGQKLSGYQFATCCYCLLNTETLQLTYARAGHPFPLLIRAGQKPKQLETKGPLLGIFDQAEFEQQTVQLERGDKLMLYSDGTEPCIGSLNDQQDFVFNKDFLKILELPAAEVMDKLNLLIKDSDIPLSEVDDVTAVALEIL